MSLAFATRTHWSIYLPALLVSLIWGALLVWADAQEPTLVSVRWLALVIEAFFVPALYFAAWVRAWGSEFVLGEGLYVRKSGFKSEKIGAALSMVERVCVRQSLLQRLLGAGTLDIYLKGGRVISLSDMARVRRAEEAFGNATRTTGSAV